jgi:geranylgeranyl diphosphate synthase type II
MDFINELKMKQDIVNKHLESLMNVENAPKSIVEAMKYSLLGGGKRIRPVLGISFCEALGGRIEDVLTFSCAIELIHTYSLIHDDLPAMDNDDFRRGRPTSHKVFGEAMAILAGDSLLNYAFEIMLNEVVKNNCQPRFVHAAKVISNASGITGMIGGQVMDIQNEDRKVNIDELIVMHSMKTGALIEASCLIGCIIAGREDKIEDVKEYSRKLGIAFQIVDDILDCIGNSEKLGKMVGSDAANHKSTFVTILGLEKSKKFAKEYSEKAKSIAHTIDSTGFIPALTDYLLNRDY